MLDMIVSGGVAVMPVADMVLTRNETALSGAAAR